MDTMGIYVGGVLIRNFTPHVLNVQTTSGEVREIYSCGIARVGVEKKTQPTVGGIFALTEEVSGEVEGLPEPQQGVFLVVSRQVATHPSVRGRLDILVPGYPERDEKGKPLFDRGVKGFARIR